ncbi:helix-turn-helix transcriptional regulator [Fructilactobacillus vespulae]|uniref:helix-turn-helix transcriptional regulator n=1 Tax=Fructilactobacillus vespulae TaxID=1249630 RepID=UPI0039B4028D
MGDQFNDYIGNKVYEYRVLAHLTQGSLADKIGVSKQTIFSIEKEQHSPTLRVAFRIANFFNVEITDIFSYKVDEEVDLKK